MGQNFKIYAESQISGKVSQFVSGLEHSGGGGDVAGVVQAFVNIAMTLSVLSAALLMSFAAYKMITSQGNPDKLKDARDQIGSAITGLLFILVSGAILLLIRSIFLP